MASSCLTDERCQRVPPRGVPSRIASSFRPRKTPHREPKAAAEEVAQPARKVVKAVRKAPAKTAAAKPKPRKKVAVKGYALIL